MWPVDQHLDPAASATEATLGNLLEQQLLRQDSEFRLSVGREDLATCELINSPVAFYAH